MSRTGIPALREGLMVWGDAGSFSYKQDYLDVKGSSPLVISTNGPSKHWILVRRGIVAHLTLVGAQLEPSKCDGGCPAILVEQGATLYLTLKGKNTARSGWGRAGIELEGSTLVITSKSTGSLEVSSDYGAGIGAGIADNESFGGFVFINGGEVSIQGGLDSAGIGRAHVPWKRGRRQLFATRISNGSVRVTGGCRAAFDTAPDISGYRGSRVVGGYDQEEFEIGRLPDDLPIPAEIVDISCAHDESIPWLVLEDGTLHATGFNDVARANGANHACVDVTYELDQPGAIAYRWKVFGQDAKGDEIFDRYWFLRGSDGTCLSGSDFLGESEDFNTHLIDGLEAGTYQLTLGVFCFGREGSVMLDLLPCA